jgi:uncharacterized protein (UPF0212 family)
MDKQNKQINKLSLPGVYHKHGFEIGMVYQKCVNCGHQKRTSCFSSRIHLQLPVLSLHVFNLKVLDVFF